MTQPAPCPVCRTPIPADAPGGACPTCLVAAGFPTGGAPMADVPAAEVERRFPEYEVRSVLGRGGMGVVYRARQRSLDREVALKILPGAPHSTGRPADFPDRFQREAKMLARLQHPGIVQIFDVATSADGWCMLAMELVEGRSLREVLSSGRIAPREALGIVPQICDALQYAHDHGVVHRDIKPENVLVTADGRVKIADFGLAKLVEGVRGASLTHSGRVLGTPHYMAPEQVERPADVDHRADIFSLGVVFYEMLTGELPIGRFAAPSRKTDVDARIDDIVMRTLEKERDARFQKASEVRTSLETGATPRRRPVGGWFHADARPGEPRTSRLAVAVFASAVALPLSQLLLWAVMGSDDLGARWTAVHFWSWIAWVALVLGGFAAVLRYRANPLLRGRALAVVGVCAGTALLAGIGASMKDTTNDRMRRLEDALHAARTGLPPWPAPGTRLPGETPSGSAPPAAIGGSAPIVVDGVEFPANASALDVHAGLQPYQEAAIRALYGRLQAMWPIAPDSSFFSEVHSPRDVEYIQSLGPEEFARKSGQGALGLPAASDQALGAPLLEWECKAVQVGGRSTRGSILLTRGEAILTVEVERERAAAPDEAPWRFAMRPIRRQ